MSDYLKNLVARSHQQAPVITPRRAALFEPVSSGSGLSGPRIAADIEITPGSSAIEKRIELVTPAAEWRPAEAPQPGKLATRIEARPRTEIDSDIPAHAGLERPGAPQPASLPPPITPATVVARRETAFASKEDATPPRRDDAPIAASRLNRDRDDPNREQPSAEARLLALARDLRRAVEERSAVHGQARSENRPTDDGSRADGGSNAKSLVVAARQDAPAVKPATRFAANPVVTADAPTIRVTIGRVDVRAIMPEAARQRAAVTRSHPALSLDQYLKQRGDGKR